MPNRLLERRRRFRYKILKVSITSQGHEFILLIFLHTENIKIPSGLLRKQPFGDNCVPSLLAGILLGVESGIPAEVKQAFQDTGTAHVIAISG